MIHLTVLSTLGFAMRHNLMALLAISSIIFTLPIPAPQANDRELKAGGFLTGTPADIIEQLKAVEKRYPGVDRVVCATPLGTPLEVQLEDLDRFAKEVMPAFRPAKIAAPAE
ncbi:MAG TPA: hypothetical protein VKC66_29495 [Xanthobacteraceae bacterium]|nr:hypothetical protein [Xanthobacteraceae bacterium]